MAPFSKGWTSDTIPCRGEVDMLDRRIRACECLFVGSGTSSRPRLSRWRSVGANATNSRFEIGVAAAMCSSEEFGQEHAHLPAVRAQRAAAGDVVIWVILRPPKKAVGSTSSESRVWASSTMSETLLSSHEAVGRSPLLAAVADAGSGAPLRRLFGELTQPPPQRGSHRGLFGAHTLDRLSQVDTRFFSQSGE